MSAQSDPMLSPEWDAARLQWYEQAGDELSRLSALAASAEPGALERAVLYAPMHDMAGLAGVFGYDLIGRIARALTERLRHCPDPIDAPTLALSRAHLTALSALHARDLRGEGGATGAAILAKLASIGA